jgi:hypothetical protein
MQPEDFGHRAYDHVNLPSLTQMLHVSPLTMA